jgi:single-stranded-DNA-specific exonuclease
VIALDCGIKSVELIRHAKEQGIDFIVCDHHLPDAELPDAVAILNPKQLDCRYPYKELCGCGIGFKLICALAERLGLPAAEAYYYLDLVATAIAADIVSMAGENRVLAYYGLKKANENPNHGIKGVKHFKRAEKHHPDQQPGVYNCAAGKCRRPYGRRQKSGTTLCIRQPGRSHALGRTTAH